MDVQDHATPSGLTCQRCGWQFSGPNPSSEESREHKRVCGTVDGYTITKFINHEHPSPKIEKKIIRESSSSACGVKQKPNRSEDMFSAGTEFSDTGISPGVTSEVKKADTHSKDADKVPLGEERDESHEDEVIDQMEFSDTFQDEGEDFYEVSVTSNIRLADKAETVLKDFKDHKSEHSNVSSGNEQSESRSTVDVFEDKSVQKSVHESQTSDHEESAFVENTVRSNFSEAKASHDKHPVLTLGELMEAEIKQAEVDHSIPVLTESAVSSLKDSVKVGSSETVVGEGSGKVLTGQDSGIGASFCSSSNSLEGIWGSVSDISDVFGKSERRLDRSYAFKDSSLVESEEEIVEQNASEVNAVKVQKTRSPKSAANEASIAKVTNWSTSGHIATTPLKRLMGEAKSPKSEQSSSLIKEQKDVAESSQHGKSTLTQENPEVNQELSPVKDSGGKLVKKKTTKVISSLVRFVCCSTPVTK